MGFKKFKTESDLVAYLRKHGDDEYNEASDEFLVDEAFNQGWCKYDDKEEWYTFILANPEKCEPKPKEKIKILIDVIPLEDGDVMYRVCDGEDGNYQADCCGGSGYFQSTYSVDKAIDDWRKENDIEIVEDHR